MPTTRTAVKTAGLSSGSEASVSPTKESQIDSRKARFSSRKKREPPAHPTPIQRIMIQFLNAIIKYIDRFQKHLLIQLISHIDLTKYCFMYSVDTRYLLWTKPSEENSILFESIEDRVYKGKYKDLSSFKVGNRKVQLENKNLYQLNLLNRLISMNYYYQSSHQHAYLTTIQTRSKNFTFSQKRV